MQPFVPQYKKQDITAGATAQDWRHARWFMYSTGTRPTHMLSVLQLYRPLLCMQAVSQPVIQIDTNFAKLAIALADWHWSEAYNIF